MQITVAELAVVGAIAPTETSSLDCYLKFVWARVRDGSRFLSGQSASCLGRSKWTEYPHGWWVVWDV
jgi:hypothetical protein